MEQLDKIVEFYLQRETNHALLISGACGAGKTFYFKSSLKKLISETPVLKNNTKNYRPIIISVFGFKSIEEIQSEIFLSLYPILKNSKLKIATSLGRLILKGVLALKGLDNANKFIDGVNDSFQDVKTSESIDLEELVICFDDLERKSPDLDMQQLLGFINLLVENKNVKVLIIANKGKGALTEEIYKEYEEKIIGNTIEFLTDFPTSYDEILKDRYISYEVYKAFLEENKSFVLKLFVENSKNLRTLIFALDYFHSIYSEIKNNLFNDDNLSDKENEILLDLLKFTLMVSVGYKEKGLTFNERAELDIDLIYDFRFFNSESGITTNDDEAMTLREKLLKGFYDNDNFRFYSSIYDFITGGSIFTYKKIIKDLNTIYHIHDRKIPYCYEVYNKLGYNSCFTLSNDEYKKTTRELIQFASEGAYDISNYLTIFHFATRFGNPLRLSINYLEKKIIKGMLIGREHYKYIPSLDMQMGGYPKEEYQDNFMRIREAMLHLNNEILSEIKSEESSELENLCYTNFDDFCEEVLDPKKSFFYNPIFNNFDSDKFYSFFYNTSPKIRWEIVKFFKAKYTDYPPSSSKDDLPFLERLKERVQRRDNYLSGNNITGFVYSEFKNELESIINRINATNYT